nr:hypothetical protein Q903MT_gene2777 [Picea sitchensis]
MLCLMSRSKCTPGKSFQCQVLYCIPTLIISGPSHTHHSIPTRHRHPTYQPGMIWMVGGQARHYCHACLP